MFWSCMIVNIPLALQLKISFNCFISAREMLSIILPCALVLLFFVDIYMLINHLLKKNNP